MARECVSKNVTVACSTQDSSLDPRVTTTTACYGTHVVGVREVGESVLAARRGDDEGAAGEGSAGEGTGEGHFVKESLVVVREQVRKPAVVVMMYLFTESRELVALALQPRGGLLRVLRRIASWPPPNQSVEFNVIHHHRMLQHAFPSIGQGSV